MAAHYDAALSNQPARPLEFAQISHLRAPGLPSRDAILRPVANLSCARCTAPRETSDNFCRRCGHQFTVNLPVVHNVGLPERRSERGLPRSVVGSVALLAVGTGAEWLARRLASTAVRGATKAVLGRAAQPQQSKAVVTAPKDVTVDEVLYIRKVQLRR